MIDIKPGQIVFSKAGRDKDRAYVVTSVDGEYAYLSDGKTREIERPKKKKLKHIRPTKTVNAEAALKLAANTAQNGDMRGAVTNYENKEN